MKQRVLLAYSGSLEATRLLRELAVRPQIEVSTLTLDLGQSEDLDEVRARALSAGAGRAHVLDAREELARDYVMPALRAGAFAADLPSRIEAVSYPLIARKLVDVAAIEGVTTVAHTCATDAARVRLEQLVRQLHPTLRVLDAGRMWGQAQGPAIDRGGPRVTVNLIGRVVSLPDDVSAPPTATRLHTLTTTPNTAPDGPAFVEITFDRGTPVAVNDVEMPLSELLESLTIIGGRHGVGRAEPEAPAGGGGRRLTGEAPAAVVLDAAYRHLLARVFADDLQALGMQAVEDAVEYAKVLDRGLWFTAEREALDARTTSCQPRATGAVRMKLFKGAQFAAWDADRSAGSQGGTAGVPHGVDAADLVTRS